MFAVIIDIALALIFIVSVITGIKRGLIRSFFSFFSTVVSFILAGLMADFFANVSYKLLFETTINTTISEFFMGQNVIDFESLNFSGVFSSFLNFIKDCIDSNNVVLERNIARLFADFTIKILKTTFIAIFYTLIKSVIHSILRMFRPRRFHVIDEIFGGIFGALKGVFFITISAMLLNFALPILNKKYDFIPKDTTNSSVILDRINETIISKCVNFSHYIQI